MGPEWYFLCQYAMLKAVPNKNAGFIVLLTSVLILYFLGEVVNLTTHTRIMETNNGFSTSFFFIIFLVFLPFILKTLPLFPGRKIFKLCSYFNSTFIFIFLHLGRAIFVG